MAKRSLLILWSVLLLLSLVSQGSSAEEMMNLEDVFETSLGRLEYSPIEAVKKEDLKKYLSYLPVLSVNHEGTGQISMGGSLTNLVRDYDQEIDFAWKQQVLGEYDQTGQMITMVAHIYNRLIKDKREAMLYKEFLDQAIPLYQQMETEGVAESQLAEFRFEIELKKSGMKETLNSMQRQMESITKMGLEITFEQIPETYPKEIKDPVELNYAPLLDVEAIRYDNLIVQNEMVVRQNKLGMIPNISVRYRASFGPNQDGIDHRLEIRLEDALQMFDYGETDYNASYTIASANGTDSDTNWETDADYGANLKLFSYPRFKEQRDGSKQLQENVRRMKDQKEMTIDQKHGEFLKEIDSIMYFQSRYSIYSLKQPMYKIDPMLSKSEQLELLIEKVSYQLKVEDFYFNYSYLLSAFERKCQESQVVMSLFSTK